MRTSIRRTLWTAILAGALATGGSFLLPQTAQADDAPKNLKILPKTMTKPDLKKLMKGIAGSLGVQCDHCHDTDDYSKDTEKKEIARTMMKMSGEINKTYFKGEMRVVCITCHNGQVKPKGPPKPT